MRLSAFAVNEIFRMSYKKYYTIKSPDRGLGMNTTKRVIHAPKGNQLNCKNWVAEAAYRMLQNNLDPEVAERPEDLVVYGGIGKAAR